MDLRTKICLCIILAGLCNFIAYTIGYSIVGGESIHGKIVLDSEADSGLAYYLAGEEETIVERSSFIYIGIHSISIWPTVAAIILSLLTLARDRIADSMRSSMMKGRSFCTTMAVLVAIGMAGMTTLFIDEFAQKFRDVDRKRLEQNRSAKQPGVSPTTRPTN